MQSCQPFQGPASECSPDASPRSPLKNRTPSPRQAQWIRASTYLVPVCIFFAGIVYFIKNPTWLDSVGSLLAFALAICVALAIRKFVDSNTMEIPSRMKIGGGLLVWFFATGSRILAHFFEGRFNVPHQSKWPGDLEFYVVALLLASPFFLFFKMQKPEAESNL